MKIEGLGTANIEKAINAKRNSADQAFEDVLQKAYTDGDKEQLKEVCKEFEGIINFFVCRHIRCLRTLIRTA